MKLSLTPTNPFLFGKGSRQPLVAVVHYSDGSAEEMTTGVSFISEKAAVATVNVQGVIQSENNGTARIVGRYRGLESSTIAFVQQAGSPLPPSFAGDVLPVLTKIGCNGGNCHGSLNGQNGFKLSLFGYEPRADYEMIVQKHDGRRLNLRDPEQSLLLLKPTLQISHGGGALLSQGSGEYDAILNWIRHGARLIPEHERQMVALQVHPSHVVLHGQQARRQLLVTAKFSDGTEGDVTHLVKFQSNDESTVAAAATGMVTAVRSGETAVVVRGPGVAAAAKVGVVLQPRPFPHIAPANFVDEHVFAKLRSLQIPLSEPADDASFLRRASLDIIGVIPTSDEVRQFLADPRPDKRAGAVDGLLRRPEYADFWALYWSERLVNSMQLLYDKGPKNFTRWLNKAFRDNMPYDQFARSLLTATGSMYDSTRPASYYPFAKKPADLAAVTSQLFLGVHIECARCHNHPFERWTQEDFRGMAAFFSQTRHKDAGPRHNEYILHLDFSAQYQDADTEQVYLPRPLLGAALAPDAWTDRRVLLADWVTNPANPFFARALVNRMWGHLMGRGLVEPVDDFRTTNPPTNEPLLDALARDFTKHGYDLHHLIRTITSSKAYQLSSVPNEGNLDDRIAYSRRYPRHLRAEQLVDSICQATGIPERFETYYPGTRASQISPPEVGSHVLDLFDRSPRKEVCERAFNLTLNQVMHRISGDTIHGKVRDESGVLTRLLAAGLSHQEIVEELYLRTVSRYPNPSEQRRVEVVVSRSPDSRKGFEDLLWALLNSKEFLYNH